MQITTIPQLPPITSIQLVIGWMSRDQISEVKISPARKRSTIFCGKLHRIMNCLCKSHKNVNNLRALYLCVLLHLEELFSKVEESVPAKWAVATWQEWVAERTPDDIPVGLTDATNQQLSYWLPLFITEARKRDGKRYPSRTLYNLCIIFVTGHRGIDSVGSYKMISDKKLQATSDILQLKKPKIKLNKECDKEN